MAGPVRDPVHGVDAAPEAWGHVVKAPGLNVDHVGPQMPILVAGLSNRCVGEPCLRQQVYMAPRTRSRLFQIAAVQRKPRLRSGVDVA